MHYYLSIIGSDLCLEEDSDKVFLHGCAGVRGQQWQFDRGM